MNWNDPQLILIALGAIAVLLIIGLIAAGVRRSRTAALREHFGSEYDHAVRKSGSQTAAEKALAARAEEAKSVEIRPLSATERDHYRSEWKKIEGRFVERPTTTVVEADELITVVMRTRGYPMADFEKYAELLSVKHPAVIEHYRDGHKAIASRTSSTEELRQAMLHYRKLFDELVGTGGTDVEREVATAREVEERPSR